jgi:hypothetical protein
MHADPKLLDIDWSHTAVATDDDARALWTRIAPTGADWEAKLAEVPHDVARPLASELLREGNFACHGPPAPCPNAPYAELPGPTPTATLDDPCLRRRLAIWALDALDAADLRERTLRDALRAIAATPAPETELVDTVFEVARDAGDSDFRLELLGIARKAGQRKLVDQALADFDEVHLVAAVRVHHIDGALEVLSAQADHDVYVAAIQDPQLTGAARAKAIRDLTGGVDPLPADTRAALARVAAGADCVAAAAALDALGQRPARPAGNAVPALMHGLCVAAAFDQSERRAEAEPSALVAFVAPKGLRVAVFTPSDPDAKPTDELVPRADAAFPERDHVLEALVGCTATICQTPDAEYHFVWKPAGGRLMLDAIELAERPGCVAQ